MARNEPKMGTIVPAAAALDQLARRATVLRGKAALAASHAELQEAATRGQLVCWQECKIVDENGSRKFLPGEKLPPDLAIDSVLLEPDRRLVTTASRWQAVAEYRRLSDYVRERQAPVEAKLRQCLTTHEAATAEVERLQLALDAAQKELRQAEAERLQAESEVRCFVERAPR